MKDDWSFVFTPHFLVGTLIAGLLLNTASAYLVRAIDRVRKALPASFRRARSEESARIEELTAAATSDNALYAALAAEASRLRLLQLLRFFTAFVCIFPFLLLVAFGELKPGMGVLGLLVMIFLVGMAGLQYSLGLGIAPHARRLDIALRAVQRNRKLRIMD